MSSGQPYAALNGKRIQSGRISIPLYGAWVADVILAVPDTIPTQSTLTFGDLSLFGSVIRMASFAGSRSARLVGGYGGWRKTIPAQAYQNPNGIRLSTILGDAAASAGEQINIAQDATIGTLFVRESAPAERFLRQLGGPEWWIDQNGVTQIGARPTMTIGSQFQVISWSGAKGMFEISTESMSDWMPSNTFSSTTVSTTQTINFTGIEMLNDGKLRLTVLT